MLASFRNFIITFLAALLVFGLCGYFITESLTETVIGFTRPEGEDYTFNIITEEADTTNLNEELTPLAGDSMSFVIIGSDYQSQFNDYNVESKYTNGFPHERNRKVEADMILAVRVDKDSRALVVCAIPTDVQWVHNGIQTTLSDLDVLFEDGFDYQTLKDTDALEPLVKKVSALTGFETNKYFFVNTDAISGIVSSVVSKIGNVKFYVPEDMEYIDQEGDKVFVQIDLHKGETNVTGGMAAQLLRYNDYKNPANSREKTTVDLLKTVADSLGANDKLDLALLLDIYNSIKSNMLAKNITYETDIKNALSLLVSYKSLDKVFMSYPVNYSGVPDTKTALEKLVKYR